MSKDLYLELPTTRPPIRQTVLRFLTSAPLIIPNRTNKNRTKITQIIASDVLTVTEQSFATDRRQTENCKDRKYSCIFWIRAHQNVCMEQKNFMRVNCAFTCGFCEN